MRIIIMGKRKGDGAVSVPLQGGDDFMKVR